MSDPQITNPEKQKDPRRGEAGEKLAAISKAAKEKKARERFEAEKNEEEKEQKENQSTPFLSIIRAFLVLVGALYIAKGFVNERKKKGKNPDLPKEFPTRDEEGSMGGAKIPHPKKLDSFDE